MPYTKSEIEKLDFYTEFRDGLRNEYLNRMSASAEITLEMKITYYIHMKIYLLHLVVKQ